MAKVVGVTTIGKLIEAHLDGDEEKFWSYVKFIRDAYQESNMSFAARVIEKYIDGSYKTNGNIITLDEENEETVTPLALFTLDDIYESEEDIDIKTLYISLVEKINSIANEHQYKVQGDRESYSEYNKGWQDAIDAIASSIKNGTVVNSSCSYTVGEALVMTEYCGCIVDFCGKKIEVTDENRDEVYGLLVNRIYARGGKVIISTYLNEDKWLAREKEKKNLLKVYATKFDGREYGREFTKEEVRELKEKGIVVLYGASDDLCELDGAIYDENDCYMADENMYCEFTITKDGFNESTIDNINKLQITRNHGVWNYKISGLFNYEEFTIVEDGEPYCRAMLFYKEDLL